MFEKKDLVMISLTGQDENIGELIGETETEMDIKKPITMMKVPDQTGNSVQVKAIPFMMTMSDPSRITINKSSLTWYSKGNDIKDDAVNFYTQAITGLVVAKEQPNLQVIK